MKAWAALAVFLVLCFAAAAIGGVATSQSVSTWYQELAKPSWNPPSWVFGPVWTVLYVLMAVAGWLVWRERAASGRGLALGLFGVQLALNGAWSWFFFAWRMPGAAFAELVLLWAAVVATTAAFWRVRRVAGALLVPYLLWTTFAGVLNFSLWRLNA